MRLAFTSLSVHVAVASVKMVAFDLLDVSPVPRPFLRIDDRDVWRWSLALLAPVELLQCVAFAGVVTLLALPLGGHGDFRRQFESYAFAFPIPVTLMLLAVWALRPFSAGIVVFYVVPAVFIGWDVYLVGRGVMLEQRLSALRAGVCTVIAYATAFALSFTFIR